MKKIYALLLLTVMGLGCAGIHSRIPDAESRGGLLYAARCSMCHYLPHPKRHTFSQWEHIIKVMDLEMEERKIPPLSPAEKAVILKYLNTHSR